MTGGTLYRLYDAMGSLLYVGITTTNLPQRLDAHRALSPWWPEVHSQRLKPFDDWRDAVLAEARAIRHEAPIHNETGWKWRGIVDDIRDLVAAGALRSGLLLPSTRDLAEHYGCATATVRMAIDILRETGELRGHQGKGVYVAGGRETQR